MGIANIINTAGGGGGGGSEIITNLVNSVDGAGLRLANQGYISCADVSANRFGTNDFSVEFVLSQETSAINADIFISNLNGSNQAVDAAVIRWDVVQNDNIQLVFTNSGATETAYNFGYDPAPDLNEPTHYLVSADRSGNAVLYRNGAEIASVSIAASGSANVGNSGQPTVIGSPVNNFGVKGNVYRLRTYSKALSSDEAKNVFDRADVPTALVSNLLLDLDCAYANPTQSTVIQDRGPNNQDDTLNGTITQTNVIKQLNSTSARIGTSAATPADGEVIANSLKATDGASGATANSTANSLVVDSNSSQAGLSILSPTNGQGNIFFGDSGDDNAGRIEYSHSANSMEFRTAGTTAMTIDSSGNVSVNASGADAVRTLNVHGTNGASELYTFAIEADGANAKTNFKVGSGGGAAATKLSIDSTGNVQIGTGSLAAVGGGPTLGLVGAAPEITLRDSASGTPFAVMRTNDHGDLILEADNGDDAGSSNIEFKVDGATAATIASGGLATFSGGINLGNTVSATATTLDGYEEGTFEVTNASDSSGVLTSETGEYTRIGNCVFIRVVIRVGTTFASNKVGGLPFGSVSDNGTSSWSPIGTALTGSATNAPILVSAKNGEANLYFHKQANTTTAHLPSTSEEYYRVTGFYYTTDAF